MEAIQQTYVIIVRHAETLWNAEGRRQGHLDSPLTEIGESQAIALAERLSQDSFSVLYSSDLGRAYKTARYISKKTGHSILVEERLRERNLGIFDGLSKMQILKRYSTEYHNYKTNGIIPNGESTIERFNRAVSCIEELAQRHFGETIVIVSHGGILDSLFRHTFSIPLDVPRNFLILNASYNVFYYKSGIWALQTWGDISHMPFARALDEL